jgi:V/A-type H+-transporting ATPase subunit K
MDWTRHVAKRARYAIASLTALLALAGTAAAAEGGAGLSTGEGMAAIGAGTAVALTGLGTGLAMKDIGSSAIGAVAEDSDLLGAGIIMVAIPETIVIFGFVIAFLLIP